MICTNVEVFISEQCQWCHVRLGHSPVFIGKLFTAHLVRRVKFHPGSPLQFRNLTICVQHFQFQNKYSNISLWRRKPTTNDLRFGEKMSSHCQFAMIDPIPQPNPFLVSLEIRWRRQLWPFPFQLFRRFDYW